MGLMYSRLPPSSCTPIIEKAKVDNECDKIIIQSLREIQEIAQQRRTQKEDMDANFCLEVAGRLKRLEPCYVKLEIRCTMLNSVNDVHVGIL